MTETESKIIEVLRKGLKLRTGGGTAPITPETAIFGKAGPASLGLDSVDILEIAVLLDKHFGLMLEEESTEVRSALATISSLAAYIDAHKPSA